MTDHIHSTLSFPFNYEILKERITVSLSPLQKKVVLIALVLFATLLVAYYSLQKYFHNKVKAEDLDSTPKIEKGISIKLEKNRKYAKLQQMQEHPKGFRLIGGPLPDFLKMFIRPQGWIEKPLIGGSMLLTHRRAGFASCEGKRESMEDAEIAKEGEILIANCALAFELFGVFDGHGGSKASAFVKENIFGYIKRALDKNSPDIQLTDDAIFHALIDAFKQIDADYEESLEGTTATVVMIINDKIWVANVGDSRTILVKSGEVTQASEDAKPMIKRYKKKVEKLGGEVFFNRVNGYLAVAGAIGDKKVIGAAGQCCVPAEPQITNYSLDEFLGGYLILGCDGLYDVATTNEVGDAIEKMEKQGVTEENMAKSLVYSAIMNGSKDNVTVLVVKL